MMCWLRRGVLGFVFLWFLLGGLAHFVFTGAEMSIVPPWMTAGGLPDAWWLVVVSGVLELAGAAGLLFRRTRRAAGWGLVLLTVAVTPANVFMWQHAELFPAVPPWALLLRLPLQAVLIAAIWWSTRPRCGVAG